MPRHMWRAAGLALLLAAPAQAQVVAETQSNSNYVVTGLGDLINSIGAPSSRDQALAGVPVVDPAVLGPGTRAYSVDSGSTTLFTNIADGTVVGTGGSATCVSVIFVGDCGTLVVHLYSSDNGLFTIADGMAMAIRANVDFHTAIVFGAQPDVSNDASNGLLASVTDLVKNGLATPLDVVTVPTDPNDRGIGSTVYVDNQGNLYRPPGTRQAFTTGGGSGGDGGDGGDEGGGADGDPDLEEDDDDEDLVTYSVKIGPLTVIEYLDPDGDEGDGSGDQGGGANGDGDGAGGDGDGASDSGDGAGDGAGTGGAGTGDSGEGGAGPGDSGDGSDDGAGTGDNGDGAGTGDDGAGAGTGDSGDGSDDGAGPGDNGDGAGTSDDGAGAGDNGDGSDDGAGGSDDGAGGSDDGAGDDGAGAGDNAGDDGAGAGSDDGASGSDDGATSGDDGSGDDGASSGDDGSGTGDDDTGGFGGEDDGDDDQTEE